MSFFRKLLVCFLLVTFALILIGCASKDTESTYHNGYFYWKQSESELVDVKIVDDKVLLYYSLCFDNGYDCSIDVSAVCGDFTRFDCWGWLKFEKAFLAKTEDGNSGVVIPPKTKMSVVFVFEGEYLGGKINEDIRLARLVFLQNTVRESE